MGVVDRRTGGPVHRLMGSRGREKPFSYAAYGLNIESDLRLTGPVAAGNDAVPDALVRLGSVPWCLLDAGPKRGCFHTTPNEAYFFWAELGAYLIRDGQEIVIEPEPEADEHILSLVILGSALGILLHQRGLLTFHASAVAVDGGAVAFLGGKGEGKSALATAMYARGYGVAADDIVALDTKDAGNSMLLPGYPQLKLWPEVAAWLGDDPEALPRLHPQLEKRARVVTDGFPQVPLPLRCIYVLAEGTDLEIEPLRPHEIFVELVRHAYALRFLGTGGVTASHFEQCTDVAGSVPAFRLRRPRTLEALPDVARLVEQHLVSMQDRNGTECLLTVPSGRSAAE